jgi:hypothetical protein
MNKLTFRAFSEAIGCTLQRANLTYLRVSDSGILALRNDNKFGRAFYTIVHGLCFSDIDQICCDIHRESGLYDFLNFGSRPDYPQEIDEPFIIFDGFSEIVSHRDYPTSQRKKLPPREYMSLFAEKFKDLPLHIQIFRETILEWAYSHSEPSQFYDHLLALHRKNGFIGGPIKNYIYMRVLSNRIRRSFNPNDNMMESINRSFDSFRVSHNFVMSVDDIDSIISRKLELR